MSHYATQRDSLKTIGEDELHITIREITIKSENLIKY